MASGYPKSMINPIMADVLKRERVLKYREKDNKPPFNVTWIATYTPATPVIQDTIRRANKALKLSETWKDVDKPIGIVHKRSLNFGNLLFKRRRLALTAHDSVGSKEEKGTVRCTKEDEKKRGRKCKACKMMSLKSTVQSKSNGRSFHTPSAKCTTKMVTYLADCKICSEQYVGRTVQQIRKRISGHRGWMNKPKKEFENLAFVDEDEAALANHLRTEHGLLTANDFDMNFLFTVLQICEPNKIVGSEYQWIANMKTLTPFGLNIAKPFGIGESLI